MKTFVSIDRKKGATAILNYTENGIARAVRFDKSWTDAQAKKNFGIDDTEAAPPEKGSKK